MNIHNFFSPTGFHLLLFNKKSAKDRAVYKQMPLIPEKILRAIDFKNFSNKIKYYVCSYGGCGSMVMFTFLIRYGKTYHIHSRKPPEYLTYVGGNTHFEWFNDKRVPDEEIENYKVIYIFRNPTESQLSRWGPDHFINIQVENYQDIPDINEYIMINKDLLKYEDFFDNYLNKKINKNYNIIALNYHKLWDNLASIFKILDLPLEDIDKFPKRKEGETSWVKNPSPFIVERLNEINKSLIQKINCMQAITIIPKSSK